VASCVDIILGTCVLQTVPLFSLLLLLLLLLLLFVLSPSGLFPLRINLELWIL
jgi:hypothetical protein